MCFIHTAELEFITLQFTVWFSFSDNSPVYNLHSDSLPTDYLKGALAEGNLRVPKLMVPKADSRSTEDRQTIHLTDQQKKVCQSSLDKVVGKQAILYITVENEIILTSLEGNLVISSKIIYALPLWNSILPLGIWPTFAWWTCTICLLQRTNSY